jgi:predicted N-acyltransferase
MWELKDFVSRQDAVLIDMHKYFVDFFEDGFLVPSRVRQVLEIDKSKPVEDMIKLRNKDLNKLKKYSYEINNDPEALKFFYEKMYAPYIMRKFGKVEDFIYLKKSLRKGELILIKQNDEYISGALCEIHDNTYYCQKNGIIDENFVKDGALLATYYFPILRAKELNLTTVDFGLSKPFLTDGVLWHKNLWGVSICEQENPKRFMYLKNILFEHPFIYIDDGKLKAIIFSENDSYIKSYANSGLEFNIVDR